MTQSVQNLFRSDLIFFEEATSKEELFHSIGKQLLEKEAVNEGYAAAVAEREASYPTGLDLRVVHPGSLNVAIPHTEVSFCNIKGIAVARLNEPIEFCNMIAPDKVIPVKYAFFILNNEKTSQTNLLSVLMGFFTSGDRVTGMDATKTKEELFDYIISNI